MVISARMKFELERRKAVEEQRDAALARCRELETCLTGLLHWSIYDNPKALADCQAEARALLAKGQGGGGGEVMATCPKHGTYWGRCESCAEECRRDDEERWAKREADRIAQLEAELKAARAESAKLTEQLRGVSIAEATARLGQLDGLLMENTQLRAQLSLAEAVCEAGSACERDEWDVVETVDAYYKALAAWRAAREKE